MSQYPFQGLTGSGTGASNPALDGQAYAGLASDDYAYGMYGTAFLSYRYSEVSVNPESVPYVIIPNDNATGAGAWELVSIIGTGLSLYDASSNLDIKLDPNGDSYINGGNVGIGTSSPSVKIHIQNASSGFSPWGNNEAFVSEDTGSDNTLELLGGIDQWLMFSDGTSNMGSIRYNHTSNDLTFRVNSNDRLTIDSAGIVSMPAVYSHDINGETYVDLLINDSGELGYDSSSERYKTNIRDMEDTSWLHELRPVNFEYKKKDEDDNYTEEGTSITKPGLIAEEVEQVKPEFVFYDKEGQVEGVQYRELIPVLLKEIQELKKKIDVLEAK